VSSRNEGPLSASAELGKRVAELNKMLDDVGEQVAVLDERNAELEAQLKHRWLNLCFPLGDKPLEDEGDE